MKSGIRHAILFILFAVAAYPLLWMMASAMKTEGHVQQSPFAIPWPPYWGNIRHILVNSSFLLAYRNSILLCTASVVIAVGISALAAYAFAQMKFRLQQPLFVILLIGMIIPVHVTLIPLNRLLGGQIIDIKGTVWALMGPYVGFALPMSVLILRGAFAALPQELMEAARMDGCGPARTFWHIALPLVRPALATVIIFNFLTMWNEFAFALTLLEPSNPTLPIAIAQFKGEHDVEIARTCAALSVAVLPLLIVYFCAQKHIIRGLTAGAVKE